MNKCIAVFPVLWLLASNVFAQAGGAVTGTVIDPDGNPVAGATVNVKLTPAGAAGSAVSTAKGDFTISGLTVGDYELSIPSIGFTFRPDRKSTRLNSSHVRISYAVFCLKKKKGATGLLMSQTA